MRRSSVSLLALVAPALMLSACSAEKSEDAVAAASDAAAEAASGVSSSKAGPSIGGAVAPGVAFTYAYAFSLPAKAISSVQQEHAAACQKLGSARCRVTGINYDQPGEDQVSARTDFLLAPDIAHAFGTDGIKAVEQAEGKLENASVSGENAGNAIKLSQQDSAAVQAEIARIELRLKAPGLTRAERVELQQQIAGLQEQLRGQAVERRAKEASIATTPVSFTYASESLIGGGNTFGRAAGASWSSAKTVLSFVTLIAGVALPWVLLIGLAVLAWHGLRRRPAAAASAAEPAAPQ
ncbi:MAG: hypothetical protein ABL926_09440 [Novosphingobium sp.]|uniref:hypothetical protein n=1 Tax=Novosphingobium sp. TaxID=1874826 RepID=UPI0032B770D6